MAEEDDAQKTEEPTPRKLEQAKSKGQTTTSQEVKNWSILLAATLLIAIMAPSMAGDVRDLTVKFLAQPDLIPSDFEHLRLVLADTMLGMLLILAPLLGVLVITAILTSLAQSGFVWAPSKLNPELSKISPLKGLGRMFSTRSLVEFVKGIAKLAIVTLVSASLALPLFDDITLIPDIDLSSTLERLYILILLIAAGAVVVMTVIAVFDYVYQKYMFSKQMRMTKQEVKDEHKQSEGDPQVKARIRQLRNERARQRMMAAVPEADVVVTNPTHFAVALTYKIDEMQAPRLVAKGQDFIALKIREIAEENDVPIVENPPLARALFATVEIDEEVPMEHYQAVAEIIGYVMRLRGDTVH